jgi:hypothetical protein
MTSQNALLSENIETQKFVVQSLASALAKAKKQVEEREKIYGNDLNRTNELPEIELMQDGVMQTKFTNFNSRVGYDTFAGDVSSIYINPDDLLENMASVAAGDRHIYAESIVRQIEDRPDVDYSNKR